MRDFVYDAQPGRVVFGVGVARTHLTPEVDRFDAHAVLVIASARDADRVRTLTDPLGDRVAATFTDVREHVPVATAEAARKAAVGCDAVVCIGGGSTTGAAKAVALTTSLPIIAVPTTYSGSEVTAVWGTTEGDRKTTGTDPVVLPRTIVYDPELLATLPADLAAASAFNAMAHCVEAFWAPRRNPVSTAVAEEGVRVLGSGLRSGDPGDLLAGAYLAGLAMAGAGTGLHHKLAHVLGGLGLPHARTHAVLLPHVLAFNAPYTKHSAERVARALGVPDAVAGLRTAADAAGVPRGLRELGLREDQLVEVASRTAAVVPADNPAPVDGGELETLVRAAWSGDSAWPGEKA